MDRASLMHAAEGLRAAGSELAVVHGMMALLMLSVVAIAYRLWQALEQAATARGGVRKRFRLEPIVKQ